MNVNSFLKLTTELQPELSRRIGDDRKEWAMELGEDSELESESMHAAYWIGRCVTRSAFHSRMHCEFGLVQHCTRTDTRLSTWRYNCRPRANWERPYNRLCGFVPIFSL